MTWAVLAMGTAAGVQAQDTLQVQGTTPNLFLSHKVRKGETFYSLSRAYGLPAKDIATINKLPFEKGVQIGESVKIPLTAANFTQAASSAPGASLHPVYHRVAEKETLYRVSQNYNKVPIDNIRHWNNFSGDGLQKDSYVVIGYVKGGASAAALAHGGVASVPPATVAPPPPVASTEPAAKPQPSTPEVSKPVATTPAATTAPPATATPASDPAPVIAMPVSTPAGVSFESIFSQQIKGKDVKTEKGPGGWFKSNAVLNSGKYYALHNSAPRGTIIKVTNPLNGKFIYAKVLDAIPQLKQNAGLIIKLSDASMAALSTSDAKFYCELSYVE
ncbi:LysM domain-containing protein [Chitinophaga costaii]|uniref:LysM domain-containing protein n=2 Tax=Chitinophaga costaii TaxID=1335309 RepID=A0A1C4D5D1_9BACT|nr:LysM domain-containing protein [Chitinophaga costaii]